MTQFQESEYIFAQPQAVAGKKTLDVHVHARRNHARLGTIKWYGAWRQYAFFPRPDTVFNKGCMETINSWIDVLMEDRRATR